MSVAKGTAMFLSDVLIVDATDRLGWLAGRVLADLGAEVIKLEPPGGDRSRADWRAFNVNKRVLELDARNAADRARLEDLLRTADICLLTPGSSDGDDCLDPEALRAEPSAPGRGGDPAVRWRRPAQRMEGERPRADGRGRRHGARRRARRHARAGERAAILRMGRRAGRPRRAGCACQARCHRPRRPRRRLRPGIAW